MGIEGRGRSEVWEKEEKREEKVMREKKGEEAKKRKRNLGDSPIKIARWKERKEKRKREAGTQEEEKKTRGKENREICRRMNRG